MHSLSAKLVIAYMTYPKFDTVGELGVCPHPWGAIMDVDKIIGQRLADQSVVGGDHSARDSSLRSE